MFDDSWSAYNLFILAMVVALNMVWYVCMGIGVWPIWHHFRKRRHSTASS
ncbi:MAG: hypothetical protein ACJ71N_09140 [Terriglobales bacterium]